MKPFTFKEFTVYQEKSAMKIGTDAVLLGAWCDLKNYPDTILDIGSGTGVISLMLAQRCNASTIEAIEIDELAYQESVENFERSNWGDRLFCYHGNFNELIEEIQEEEETYDLIISNPPFYTDDYKTEDDSRNKARFTESLPFNQLIEGSSKILNQNGIFAVVIPYKEESNFVALANKYHLKLKRVCHVKGNSTSEIKRSLLEFSFQESDLVNEELIIEKERHQYTDAYIDLTKDFYLKM
ncbi:tRNA1Val (adenine37-N6)-methyltransferase [Tenacibaculum sp. MAR_2009_124]|uniref:tRNA1(Val) (adenine(37)-N6)-methyltransferase n=1 Tax=Tenacibaculum sp. MAR_2009_124 TaxID=1250059 RepID=UPI00089816F6|nr:methyltransferase [Tenacibaculum sp. MAR_2009_124]SED08443.1 tRNA1Val (adenine37-N6)-methyltransferase [Tenacibaculum sp. MAR_2009_124]